MTHDPGDPGDPLRPAASAPPVEAPIPITPETLATPRGSLREQPVVIRPHMLARRPDRRVDFERGMRYAPPVTLALIASLVVLFALEVMDGSFQTVGRGIAWEGALSREHVMAGEWWRVVTAAFLHGGPDHLMGNVLSLYVLGMACEHVFGAWRMLVLYLVSAVGGALVSLALVPGPSLGASGAIFGLMGAIVVVLHRERHRLYVRDGRIGVVIAVWAGYTFLLGAFDPVVDNGAHLGGLVAGALVAAGLRARLVR